MSASFKKKSANIFLALPDPIRRILSACGIGTKLLKLRDQLYAAEYLQVFPPAARDLRIRYLIRDFRSGIAIGSHIPGFFPFLAKNLDWSEFPDIKYENKDVPSETVLEVVKPAGSAKPVHDVSLALHIHAYYIDGLIDIKQAILINKALPDIFVTAPLRHQEFVQKCFEEYPKKFTFIACENLGRDIVPFLNLLPELTNRYDLIGHIHLKQSVTSSSVTFAKSWSTYLLGSLIGDCNTGTRAIDNIAYDFGGRQSPPALYIPHMMEALGWEANLPLALNVAADMGLADLPQQFIFSAGTMFWGSSGYLACFQNIKRDWQKLAKEPVARDGNVLHAIERLFGAIAVARGETIIIAPPIAKPFTFSEKVMNLCFARRTKVTRDDDRSEL